MKKLPMMAVVPGDHAGTSKKYRTQRILVQVAGRLIPICWTVIAPDGSISFGLAGDAVLTTTGPASFDPAGRIAFETGSSLDELPVADRQKTHVTIHPTGACHLRCGNFRPVLEHELSGWFPVRAGFRWLQAFTSPVGALPVVQAIRRRDAVMPFPNLESSARIEVSIFPRTADASVPLLEGEFYTFAGISPHHIVRLIIDAHPGVVSTLIIREKMGKLKLANA